MNTAIKISLNAYVALGDWYSARAKAATDNRDFDGHCAVMAEWTQFHSAFEPSCAMDAAQQEVVS